jgi:hypothetical protein
VARLSWGLASEAGEAEGGGPSKLSRFLSSIGDGFSTSAAQAVSDVLEVREKVLNLSTMFAPGLGHLHVLLAASLADPAGQWRSQY